MIPVAVLLGLCEGSAMVADPAQPDTVLIADNEREDRLFRFTLDGVPLAGMEGVGLGEVLLGTPVEDIEALASDATNVWVVGSQSRSKSGEERSERQRIVQVHGEQSSVWTIDWKGCEVCSAEGFEASRNVEGATVWGAHLWLGLRAPLVEGRALLVQLTPTTSNVLSVTASYAIDLGGLGIVDLAVRPGGDDVLYILGGASVGKAPGAVFELQGPQSTPQRRTTSVPEDAEGLVVLASGGARLITDGAAGKDDVCKTTSTLYRSDKL